MEFELQYTTEQEEFRKEVKAWLEKNVTNLDVLKSWPLEESDVTLEQWQWKLDLRHKLGSKGWLFPTMPTEYGGGGLTLDKEMIIGEELEPYDLPGERKTAIAGIYVWGTEEQKQKFLKPVLTGETNYINCWTEPDAGVDLASIKTTAIKDGDDYVFNGIKCYISFLHMPDFFWTLAVTDPDAPRHANVGHFYMPTNLPGITRQNMPLINRGSQNFVFFDNVRVPKEYLIAGETQGWQVAQTALEMEHGGAGNLTGRGTGLAYDLMNEWREGKVHSMAQGNAAKEHIVDALIRADIHRLIQRRNFWMFRAKQHQTYHGAQGTWYGRETRIRSAEDYLDLLGPHSLMEDEKWGLLKGRMESAERNASMATHAAGSYEVDKVIIARRIGMSRTKEVAAPTHQSASTA